MLLDLKSLFSEIFQNKIRVRRKKYVLFVGVENIMCELEDFIEVKIF